MEYRTLGKTGLKVSVLSYGASPLGSEFRKVTEQEAIETVRTALDLGMNYIDVSPFYGRTTSELLLGKALRGIPRDRYCMATKVGRYGVSYFDFSAARVTRSVDESLSRMELDYIDVIQCHDVEFVSLDQVVNEAIPALERLKETGKVRFIGITGLPFKIFRYVLEHADIDTILSYCRYTLNDTSLTSLIPFLREKQAGIISASSLNMGLLTNRGGPPWHPASDRVKEACRQAALYCQARGGDLAKLALQYALANEDIHTTLIGSASPENLRRNAAWIEEPMDGGLLAGVMQILAPVLNEGWPSGLPENN